MNTIKNLEYPESTIWYILVRDLEIIGYGSIESNQVLSTTAEIAVYETEMEWQSILLENGIEVDNGQWALDVGNGHGLTQEEIEQTVNEI